MISSEFKASVGYVVRSCLKKKTHTHKKIRLNDLLKVTWLLHGRAKKSNTHLTLRSQFLNNFSFLPLLSVQF